MTVRTLTILFLVLLATICQTKLAYSQASREHQAISITAKPWPEADSLFKKDRSWLGGDGAYSVNLKNGRVLWLFADTFVADGPVKSRREAKLIRNSLAIQHGYDPSSASIVSEAAATLLFKEGELWDYAVAARFADLMPYSRATPARDFFSWPLARERRDITVPIGISKIAATSL